MRIFLWSLAPPATSSRRLLAEVAIPADQEQPEPMPEDGLDVGGLVAEQLALAIDPYPRKEGADLGQVLDRLGIDAQAGKPNPFAALEALKTKG